MDNTTFDDLAFREQFTQAQTAAKIANMSEPRAVSAMYDATNYLVVIHFKNGSIFSFPPAIAQGLTEASPEDLARVELTPSGDALHWENLDADLSIPDLLMGVFGSKKWMAKLQRQWLNQQAS
jgi:hypothetical protein